MLWLITAALGDVPTAILACAGLLLGISIMARGPRRADAPAPVRDEPAAPSQAPAPQPIAPVPSAVAGAPATTFRQGAIRLAGEPEPEPQPVVAAEPAPADPGPAQPQAPAAEEESAPAPPPSPMPEFPPTDFRQGRIRVGGLERGKPPREE